MMWWHDYLNWFTVNYDLRKNDFLETGKECGLGPELRPTRGRLALAAPWRSEWGVVFDDGYYFRVKESFNVIGRPNVGAGLREHFSFHYGRAHASQDSRGYPLMREPDTPPADLRIDIDGNLDPHIHLDSVDHIPQSRVQGFSIRDADMFAFLDAVRNHRKTGETLAELLNITVVS